jgi:hypothetical protein
VRRWQKGHRGARYQAGGKDHLSAAEATRKPAGERHGEDGPQTQAKEQESKLAIVERETDFDKGHEGRPRSHGESGDEERNAGCHLLGPPRR